MKEREGILNWIISGWQRYQKEGLNMPSTLQTALNEYSSECDILKQFIEECYVDFRVAANGVKPGSATEPAVKLKDFTASYNAWCKENNYRGSNSRTLAGDLRSAGYDVTNGAGNALVIYGLGIKDA